MTWQAETTAPTGLEADHKRGWHDDSSVDWASVGCSLCQRERKKPEP